MNAGPSAADIAICRALLRHGSKSFHAASLLLPRRVRDPATALYAFCRLGDDAVDLAEDPREGLALMQARLDAAYAGQPQDHAADRAFAATVRAFDIPKELPAALLEGFAWDAAGRRYETLDDLHAYAARVAGTVGAMMALVMGKRSHAALARATDLGTAMQLTNIARDVGEDAAAGRLYLPLEWLRGAGIDPEAFLRSPAYSGALARIVARLLAEARRLYVRAQPGIGMLPRDCRGAIRAAHLIYAEIGAEVARAGHDSITRRAVVSTRRKLGLVLQARLPRPSRARSGWAPALEANAFLLAAVRPTEGLLDGHTLDERIGWAIELFSAPERRGRLLLPRG
jgi:phytoene synthase